MKKSATLLVCFLLFAGFGTQNSAAQEQKAWLLKLEIPGTGNLETVFNFRFRDSTFEAYAKGEQARSILGFWKYSLTRVFSDKFKSNSIAYINNGKWQQQGDERMLKGLLNTPLGNRYLKGSMNGERLRGYLLNGGNDTIGDVSGHPFQGSMPLRDYPVLVDQALDTIAQYLYDPQLLETDDWQDFKSDVTSLSGQVKDDLGMLLAFAYLQRNLPFSHLGLTRQATRSNKSNSSPDLSNLVRLKALSDSTVKMTIFSFAGSGEEVQQAFRQVKARGYQHLVVDLRFNGGGGIEAGMAFINQLLKEKLDGGIFLTRNYFRNHDSPPEPADYDAFPTLAEANYEVLTKGIHQYEGIAVQTDPVKDPYQGEVYVLTGKRTASTCEPLVYALKQYNRAKIIGQPTAGAMLSAESFALSEQYKVFLPTATYYTADGHEIDQQGVKPDFEVATRKAVQYTRESLIRGSEE